MPGLLDPVTTVALLCGLGAALTFGLVAFALVDGPGARRFKRRLQGVNRRARGVSEAGASATRSLSRRESATPTMDRIVRRWIPRRDILAQRLTRTGREITIGHYTLVTVGLIAGVTLVASFGFGIRAAQSAMIGVAVGIALPHMVVGRMGKRRVGSFIALFPEAIDLMVRALRSGLPISEAIISAGNEIADPVGAEFRTVEGGMRLGRELEALLWETAKRIDAPEFRFFIIALSVQRETGGNLAETLGNLADVLRRRRAMRSKARAMSSEARASTMILGSLPLVVTVILLLTSPSYIMTLFTDVRGLMLCGIAIGMLAFGVLVMTRMAKFDI
ncbi:MAG: type II secretion system F family protein [Alphaproteobacteria bacterium]|nr:type II secretion system F family protein [Alphaproteobacteria bacterium]